MDSVTPDSVNRSTYLYDISSHLLVDGFLKCSVSLLYVIPLLNLEYHSTIVSSPNASFNMS